MVNGQDFVLVGARIILGKQKALFRDRVIVPFPRIVYKGCRPAGIPGSHPSPDLRLRALPAVT